MVGFSVPLCVCCNKKVYPIESIQVNERSWHKQHFRCCKCDTVLKLGNYKYVDNCLYCPRDAPVLGRPSQSAARIDLQTALSSDKVAPVSSHLVRGELAGQAPKITFASQSIKKIRYSARIPPVNTLIRGQLAGQGAKLHSDAIGISKAIHAPKGETFGGVGNVARGEHAGKATGLTTQSLLIAKALNAPKGETFGGVQTVARGELAGRSTNITMASIAMVKAMTAPRMRENIGGFYRGDPSMQRQVVDKENIVRCEI